MPPPFFTRLTLPVPVPWALLRITPWKVQSAALSSVSVLLAFRPVLSYSPSITACESPLIAESVCAWPLRSKRELASGVLNVMAQDEAIWLSPLSCRVVLTP